MAYFLKRQAEREREKYLEAEVTRLKVENEKLINKRLEADLKALRARCERLEGALKALVDECDLVDPYASMALENAKKALGVPHE